MFRILCIACVVSATMSVSAYGELLGPAEFGSARMLYDAETGHVFVSANHAEAFLQFSTPSALYETVALSPAPGDDYRTFPTQSAAIVNGIVTDLHLSNIDAHMDFSTFTFTYFKRPDGQLTSATCNDATRALICIPEPVLSPFGMVFAIAGLRVTRKNGTMYRRGVT